MPGTSLLPTREGRGGGRRGRKGKRKILDSIKIIAILAFSSDWSLWL